MKAKKSLADLAVKLLWVAAALASIKSIFTDAGFDNAYTVAMAYRHINGDSMLTRMWEPHQTSMFVAEFLMRLYHLVVPSYTGVVIYLQICGTLLYALICIPLYKLFIEYSDKYTANIACIIFMLLRVKQSPFPEYSNLLIGFSALLFILLIKFIQDESKLIRLILAAFCLCLAVLSYPSYVIALAAVIIILATKTNNKFKNILLFTATCAIAGLAYVGFFLIKIGFDGFIFAIKNIFLADSHKYAPMYSTYFQGMLPVTLWIVGSLLLGLLTSLILKKHIFKDSLFLPSFGVWLIILGLVLILVSGNSFEFTCAIYAVPIMFIIFAFFMYGKLPDTVKTVWLTGLLISVSSFLAAMMLTNLGILTILSFLVLGGIVSLIPICTCKKEALSFVMCVCLFVILHRGLVVWGYGNKWGVNKIYHVENIVRHGPSAGVVCDYMTYYMTECNIRDHHNYINDNDKVFLIDTWVFDPMEFVLIPGRVSNASTIDTPIYNEHTLDYFISNPDKKPSVVAVSCWYGQLMVENDSFIMNWVNDNYVPVGDGSYWRYYREKQ